MQTSLTTWHNSLSVDAAQSTIDAYTYELNRFAQFHADADLLALTYDDLTAYIASRRETGIGQSSIYRAVSALRSFYKFHLRKESPAARLPHRKPPITLHRTLTLHQLTNLLASIDTSAPIGRRDLALVCFMADTGFRSAEVCRIEDRQVDLTNRLAWTTTKGGQTGFGAISEVTAIYCATWRADRATMAHSDAFFVGFEGHRTGEQLTTAGLRCLFRRLGKRAGLEAFSPHDLRRTFGTLTTELGAPSRIVQIGGRWHDLKLVERYTQAVRLNAIRPYLPITATAQQVNT
jgi:site-specific recombinase XerD